ncbi:MAG: TlpA family protein disulfide reductase, partial [Acidobacteriota bacterium]
MRKILPYALAIFFFMASGALCAEVPKEGQVLPAFQLSSPPVKGDADYLGIKRETFGIKDIECKAVLVEIIGVYCQRCYQQVPLFNKLFARLEKKGLGDKIKMLAVAAGGTVNEVEHLRASNAYEYPVVKDE